MKENIKYMKLILLVIKSTLQIIFDYHQIPAASKLWHCLLNPEKMFVMFHVKNDIGEYVRFKCCQNRMCLKYRPAHLYTPNTQGVTPWEHVGGSQYFMLFWTVNVLWAHTPVITSRNWIGVLGIIILLIKIMLFCILKSNTLKSSTLGKLKRILWVWY